MFPEGIEEEKEIMFKCTTLFTWVMPIFIPILELLGRHVFFFIVKKLYSKRLIEEMLSNHTFSLIV